VQTPTSRFSFGFHRKTKDKPTNNIPLRIIIS